MISKYIAKHIEQKEAFHMGCHTPYKNARSGLVRPLFDMLICDRCHKTLDDDSQIIIRASGIWSLKRK